MFETGREGESGVALYCRKVLIQSKTENIVPKWMRFVKGVVDSEDIPLNLSRQGLIYLLGSINSPLEKIKAFLLGIVHVLRKKK